MALAPVTLKDLAIGALRDIGCLRPGQSPGADYMADILSAANQMIDSWLLDQFMVYTDVVNAYTLTAGKQIYTIGPVNADFIAPRPTQIDDANIILNTYSPVLRQSVGLINQDQWAAIQVQQLPSAIPMVLYYDKNFDPVNGSGTLYMWPGPLTTYQLELYTWQQLQQFADLTTPYIFPPGYQRLIRKCLALEIVPMMKVYFKIPEPLIANVAQQADDAMYKVKSYNAPAPVLNCDAAVLSNTGNGFNWLDGLPGRGIN